MPIITGPIKGTIANPLNKRQCEMNACRGSKRFEPEMISFDSVTMTLFCVIVINRILITICLGLENIDIPRQKWIKNQHGASLIQTR